MSRKRFLVLIVAVVAIASLAVAGCAPEAAPPAEEEVPPEEEEVAPPAVPEEEIIEWRLQAPFPSGMGALYGSAENVAKYITEMSGGRLMVNDFPGGAIVPALTEMHAVHDGVLDATVTGSHYHTGEIGLAGDLYNLYPAGLCPRETIVWVYEGGGLEMWQEMYDRKGFNIHVVGPCGFTSAEGFGWMSEPMESLDDFKGLKFRTAGCWGEMITEMGAAVVFTPGGEIYEAMQRGVIDAFEFSTPGLDYGAGFHELGAYLHGPGIHAPQSCFEMLVNKDRWNELSPDLQAIVTHAAQAVNSTSWAYSDYSDLLAVDELIAYGTKFVILPEDLQREIVKVANEYYDRKALEDPFFAKVLESQRDFVRRYRAYKAFWQPDPDIMTWPPEE